MPEPPSRYSGAQKALHWTMAALIVTQVAIAIAMTNLGEGPLTNNLYELHKSFGLTVLALALVRVAIGACAVRRPSSRCPTGSAAPRRSRMRRSTSCSSSCRSSAGSPPPIAASR